jgi:hypothetical protein
VDSKSKQEMKNTPVKYSFIAGIGFAVMFGLVTAICSDLKHAILEGPLAGLLFTIGIYFFLRLQNRHVQSIGIDDNENDIIFSGGANHIKNGEAVGGRLFLLSKSLRFKSHNYNLQNHELDIEVFKITHITFFNMYLFIPNGLQIETKVGKVEKFIVENRIRWKEEIEKIKEKHETS